jgi:hypothetical protein
MAALSFTAATFTQTSGSTGSGTAGATIAIGDVLYLDTGVLKKADCLTSAKAAIVGVALVGGVSGQPITYATGGVLSDTTGTPFAAGAVYCLHPGTGNGDMGLESDVASTNYLTIVGWGLTANTMQLNMIRTGVIHA